MPPGEVHAIMGPNGSGKSRLRTFSPDVNYDVTQGEVLFEDLLAMDPEERREGVSWRFSIRSRFRVSATMYFPAGLAQRHPQARGEAGTRCMDFTDMSSKRRWPSPAHGPKICSNGPVNEGFSGGEKKRNEIFQMAVLEPRLASWMRPIRAWTSTRCGPWPKASMPCAVRIVPS